MQLLPAHVRWAMSSFPRRVTDVLECHLGQGWILAIPFRPSIRSIVSQCFKAKDRCQKMFLIPPIDFLGCSLRVVSLATLKLSLCKSWPLVLIETCIVLPFVVALVLDPECSLRCRQVSPILLETLIRSGLDHLPLFSRLIRVGYLAGLVRLRRLWLAFIRFIMPALFLPIEELC